MHSPAIQKLINQFSKFPTVGPRTATRFVFYLLKLSKEEIDDLIFLIGDLKNKIKLCQFCFNFFEPSQTEEKFCKICQDSRRNRTLLCIIEKETDLIPIEKTKKYNGLYFILGGTLSTFKKKDVEKLRTKELVERIKTPKSFGLANAEFKEVIIAVNPTAEGEATALYLERLLKPLTCGEPAEPIKITRLGRGLPIGGELEYADEETLGSSLEGRK